MPRDLLHDEQSQVQRQIDERRRPDVPRDETGRDVATPDDRESGGEP
jgi:hypothetical protein